MCLSGCKRSNCIKSGKTTRWNKLGTHFYCLLILVFDTLIKVYIYFNWFGLGLFLGNNFSKGFNGIGILTLHSCDTKQIFINLFSISAHLCSWCSSENKPGHVCLFGKHIISRTGRGETGRVCFHPVPGQLNMSQWVLSDEMGCEIPFHSEHQFPHPTVVVHIP